MRNFEVKKVGGLDTASGDSSTEFYGFVCQSDAHRVEMSREDAETRGIVDKWADGYVRTDVYAEVLVVEQKYSVPRAGKRPAVEKAKECVVMCPKCNLSERVVFSGVDSALFRHLLNKVGT